MTIASLVRRTLGLKHHKVVKVVDSGGRVIVQLDRIKLRHLPCSVCGTYDKVRDRLPERSWRHVPLWGIAVELRYRPCRVSCSCCEAIKVEAIPWSAGKSPISQPLIAVLATWSRLLAWDVVASLFGVSWSTVVEAVESPVLGRASSVVDPPCRSSPRGRTPAREAAAWLKAIRPKSLQ